MKRQPSLFDWSFTKGVPSVSRTGSAELLELLLNPQRAPADWVELHLEVARELAADADRKGWPDYANTLRRQLDMLETARSSGDTDQAILAAWLLATSIQRMKADAQYGPVVHERMPGKLALAARRHKAPQKADERHIREVLDRATSNKDAARQLKVSLRTITTYRKKYAQA